MYNYTIIIPHRNSVQLLLRCINSIPKRTDIQIIVVDDASDLSQEDIVLMNNINSKDINVIFLKESKTAGGARNIGMSFASGKWLLFADADDFFNDSAFDVFDKYLNSNVDVVYFGANSIYLDTLRPAHRADFINDLLENYLVDKQEDILKASYVSPVCKLIKKSLVDSNDIKFDELLVSNDIMFSLKSNFAAKKIDVNLSKVYCITVSKGSLVYYVSKERNRIRYTVTMRRCAFLKSIGKEALCPRIQSRLVHSLRFGLGEFVWCLKETKKYNVSVVKGLIPFLCSGIRNFFKKNQDKKYYIIEK